MNNRPKIRAAKYTIYCLFMLALYILQTTPGFLSIGGLKPNFVIPVAMAIAVCEGDFPGGIFGAVAGILCDFSATSLFGFQAAILLALLYGGGLIDGLSAAAYHCKFHTASGSCPADPWDVDLPVKLLYVGL